MFKPCLLLVCIPIEWDAWWQDLVPHLEEQSEPLFSGSAQHSSWSASIYLLDASDCSQQDSTACVIVAVCASHARTSAGATKSPNKQILKKRLSKSRIIIGSCFRIDSNLKLFNQTYLVFRNNYIEKAIVVISAFSACLESKRVCWITTGILDLNTDA